MGKRVTAVTVGQLSFPEQIEALEQSQKGLLGSQLANRNAGWCPNPWLSGACGVAADTAAWAGVGLPQAAPAA